MALQPGARVGPYEIAAMLGEGGMGQVYRARDTKLNRDVAVKVLPELFAVDPDRLARFTREAQPWCAARARASRWWSIWGWFLSDGRILISGVK